ncbi:thioredoxin-like protein [Mycotypha africana]|uniref:thioredoxin-like protein n=1 Tax=Mycotypha africana TaxID=64632 RepID=UPI0023009B06|nr:thioredoxin-like protein [Mycotypha africana]KAI8975434.1 thioredoxin-like protein [Mycotypha africana]
MKRVTKLPINPLPTAKFSGVRGDPSSLSLSQLFLPQLATHGSIMKPVYSILVLVITFITFCKAAIVQLTDENFSDLVKKEDEWLIDFYADWCGYCKRLEPKFQAADRMLKFDKTHSHVQLGKVNVDNNPGLAARFFISRLPTLVHIKDREVRQVQSTRTDNDIISFVTLEQWRDVKPKNGLLSPFSLFGHLVGFTGKLVKKVSSYSPWTLIGLLTGFLILSFGLLVLSNKKTASPTMAADNTEQQGSKDTEDIPKQIANRASLRERKSKRVD